MSLLPDEIYSLLRDNIKALVPYSTARDECKVPMQIYLDANENPFENGVNRYPSPSQEAVKQKLSRIKKVKPENIFLGNGSDEAIDLVYRLFCSPGRDSALIVSPSYGMYGVAARINDIKVIESYLDKDFSLNAEQVMEQVEKNTRAIFICSPNNPSGNLLAEKEIEKIAATFTGITVVDEAYIDFSGRKSLCGKIGKYPRMIVLQTMSKAWGMAGLRIGLAMADPRIIRIMNQVKYPYNLNAPAQQKILELLEEAPQISERTVLLIKERDRLAASLRRFPVVEKVFPSDSNFLLVRFARKQMIFDLLKAAGIIVRDRSSLPLCEKCLRITVGTPAENKRLLQVLAGFCDTTKENDETVCSGNMPDHPVDFPFSCKQPAGMPDAYQTFLADRTEMTAPGEEANSENFRSATINRKTRETGIQVAVQLDVFREPFVSTGLHFFDHMLEQIGYHGGIGLWVLCTGDLATDDHHTIEDTAIALGDALAQALGRKEGIERYGFALPMDEAQAFVLLDLGGRIDFQWEVSFLGERIGDVNSQMFEHFFKTLAQHLSCNLHIRAKGKNDHHIIEGIFKAFARALKAAVRKDRCGFSIPSSKGVL